MRPTRARQVALIISILLVGTACRSTTAGGGPAPASSESDRRHQSLLTAYGLLEDTLSQEAQLDWLALLRKITFRSPVPEIRELMGRIDETSETRLEELEGLRTLDPDVTASPDYADPLGPAITGHATDIGMDEMLALEGYFGIRFILLQAQATRMISAIARATADRETNSRRKKWLLDVAAEYESIRDELVEIIVDYVLQRGAAQQPDG